MQVRHNFLVTRADRHNFLVAHADLRKLWQTCTCRPWDVPGVADYITATETSEHSFPTRRSSDLEQKRMRCPREGHWQNRLEAYGVLLLAQSRFRIPALRCETL